MGIRSVTVHPLLFPSRSQDKVTSSVTVHQHCLVNGILILHLKLNLGYYGISNVGGKQKKVGIEMNHNS